MKFYDENKKKQSKPEASQEKHAKEHEEPGKKTEKEESKEAKLQREETPTPIVRRKLYFELTSGLFCSPIFKYCQ